MTTFTCDYPAQNAPADDRWRPTTMQTIGFAWLWCILYVLWYKATELAFLLPVILYLN